MTLLVYLSPECAVSPAWINVIKTVLAERVRLIAVDEAHCVAEW